MLEILKKERIKEEEQKNDGRQKKMEKNVKRAEKIGGHQQNITKKNIKRLEKK